MILLLTSSYPADDGDYRGRFVQRFAAQLVERGECVRVLTPATGPGARFGSLYGGFGIVENVKRSPAAIRHLLPSMRGIGERTCALARTARAIIAHWLFPFGLVAAYTWKRHRRPVWIVCHSGGVRVLAWLPRSVRERVGEVLVGGSRLLSFVTPALRDEFLALVGRWEPELRRRSRVLPMGVDAAHYARVRRDPDGPIVFVGRLARIKALERLIEVVAEQPAPPPVRLVGDGPERPALQRLAARRRLEVTFAGSVPHSRVSDVLDGACLATVPSRRTRSGRREGLPLFALEALASGLPFLTTRTWDMPEALARCPGVYRSGDSRADLSEALTRALAYARRVDRSDDETLRRTAALALDWSAVGARAHGIYRELTLT